MSKNERPGAEQPDKLAVVPSELTGLPVLPPAGLLTIPKDDEIPSITWTAERLAMFAAGKAKKSGLDAWYIGRALHWLREKPEMRGRWEKWVDSNWTAKGYGKKKSVERWLKVGKLDSRDVEKLKVTDAYKLAYGVVDDEDETSVATAAPITGGVYIPVAPVNVNSGTSSPHRPKGRSKGKAGGGGVGGGGAADIKADNKELIEEALLTLSALTNNEVEEWREQLTELREDLSKKLDNRILKLGRLLPAELPPKK